MIYKLCHWFTELAASVSGRSSREKPPTTKSKPTTAVRQYPANFFNELRPTIKFARIVVKDLDGSSPADRAKGSKAHLSHFVVAVQKNGRDGNRHDWNDNCEETKRPSERAICME